MGTGIPSPCDKKGLLERHKLPQRGLRHSTSRINAFGGFRPWNMASGTRLSLQLIFEEARNSYTVELLHNDANTTAPATVNIPSCNPRSFLGKYSLCGINSPHIRWNKYCRYGALLLLVHQSIKKRWLSGAMLHMGGFTSVEPCWPRAVLSGYRKW